MSRGSAIFQATVRAWRRRTPGPCFLLLQVYQYVRPIFQCTHVNPESSFLGGPLQVQRGSGRNAIEGYVSILPAFPAARRPAYSVLAFLLRPAPSTFAAAQGMFSTRISRLAYILQIASGRIRCGAKRSWQYSSVSATLPNAARLGPNSCLFSVMGACVGALTANPRADEVLTKGKSKII